MARVAWTALLRPDRIEEYERAHAAVWPTVLQAIKDAGVRNYSIHGFENRIFGYFECDDPERSMREMGEGQVAAGWDVAMRDLFEPEVLEHGVDHMKEIFRFD